MADDTQNQTPSKWVRVRAKVQRGIIRGGIHWPQTESFQQVTEDQFELLRSEPLLEVTEISESEIPEGQRPAPAEPEDEAERKAREAELLKNAEFPARGAGPASKAQVLPSSTATAARTAADATPPPSPTGVSELSQPEDPPGSDQVSASAGLSDEYHGGGRRRR